MKRAVTKNFMVIKNVKLDKCSKEAVCQIKFQGGNNYGNGSST